MDRQNIRSFGESELRSLVEQLRIPAFRAKQLWEWLYARSATSFDEMSNLPKALRAQLSECFFIPSPTVLMAQASSDGTRKYLVSLDEDTSVETVGIPSKDGTRLTVCVSSQAGCAMGCAFCATGMNGFARNLRAYEIYDQVRLVERDFDTRASNVVVMGQGEPFANYDETISALRLLNDERLCNIGARHITVSTCGIVDGIRRFSTEPEQFTLAVSLHSAIQDTRDALMPGTRAYPLTLLKQSLKDYGDITKRRPSLEYAPIAGMNDDDAHLETLVDFCRGMMCHVNLIPLNPVVTSDTDRHMIPSSRINVFEHELISRGIETSIRTSRGGDIDGACGQLRQRLLV